LKQTARHNKLVRSVVAPVSAVAMLAGLSFVAPSAMAADNLSCDQGMIYGINQSDRSIYSINTATGATKQVPGSVLGNNANGLGVNKDGSAAYAVQQAGQFNATVKILKYTAESGSSNSVGTINLGGAVQGSYLVGGAVSPFTDIYYFGGWTSDAKFALFGWNTAKDEALGLIGYITADTTPSLRPQANGDLAFDASGNLYLVNSNSGTQIELRIPAASVPTAAGTGDINGSQVASGKDSGAFNGVAYDASGTFYMSQGGFITPGFGG
jgi:sugar lactone lactonase YvrE